MASQSQQSDQREAWRGAKRIWTHNGAVHEWGCSLREGFPCDCELSAKTGEDRDVVSDHPEAFPFTTIARTGERSS